MGFSTRAPLFRAAGAMVLAVAAFLQASAPAHAHNPQGGQGAAASYTSSTGSYDIPAVALTDMNGATALLSDELGSAEPILLEFMYTTCATICPVLSATLADVQETLDGQGIRARLISISIDPDHDSPARLLEFAAQHGARETWHLFTGRPADIEAVQKSFNAWNGAKANHLPLVYIRPSPGAPWLRLEGFASAEEIVDEFHRTIPH